jgi:hypothetical protein
VTTFHKVCSMMVAEDLGRVSRMQCEIEDVRVLIWMIGMDESRVNKLVTSDRNQVSKTYKRMVPLKLLPSQWKVKTRHFFYVSRMTCNN